MADETKSDDTGRIDGEHALAMSDALAKLLIAKAVILTKNSRRSYIRSGRITSPC